MSRFLITTMPATGHVTPFLPLATELSARGHQVLWHTGEEFATRVARTGARFTTLVDTPDFTRIPVVPDPDARGMAAGVSLIRRLFVDRVRGQVADYRRILADFPADLLIADMCSFGADTLHAAGGPPYATVGINPLVTLDPEIPRFGTGKPPATTPAQRWANRLDHWLARRMFLPKVTALLNAARVDCGAPPLPAGVQFSDRQRSPFLHLMPTTPAFEYPRAHLETQVQFIGPLLPATPSDFTPPSWWAELAGRRVVHITQGTYATDESSLLLPTIEALAGQDLLVVATTPDPDAVGPVPANVRLSGYLPHRLLLPYVDVMVTNAGYNGVLTALAHGVPLLCAGRSEDKADVSARVAWSGAGIDLRTTTPTPEQILTAVNRLLAPEPYRGNARRIAADFATHDAPREAAGLLDGLVRAHSVGVRR
jgi:UDP:flavonoid glycosyltransferase YjiC (YdhE family)